MGTDVRKLVHDGYPASAVMGSDLRAQFIDAGYQLYQDKSTCKIHFFRADIFDIVVGAEPSAVQLSDVKALWQLSGRVKHLYAGALFHLFDEATQYAIAVRFGTLLKREKGAVIFGRHQGLENEGVIPDHLDR